MAARKRKAARSTRAKAKTAPSRRAATTKRKVAARAALASGDVQKDLTTLKGKLSRIAKDLDSSDAKRATRAGAALDKFHSDLESWAKKNGVKLVPHAVKHESSQDPTAFIHRANTHGCPEFAGGILNNKVTVCFFRRYNRLRGECRYVCVVTDIE